MTALYSVLYRYLIVRYQLGRYQSCSQSIKVVGATVASTNHNCAFADYSSRAFCAVVSDEAEVRLRTLKQLV